MNVTIYEKLKRELLSKELEEIRQIEEQFNKEIESIYNSSLSNEEKEIKMIEFTKARNASIESIKERKIKITIKDVNNKDITIEKTLTELIKILEDKHQKIENKNKKGIDVSDFYIETNKLIPTIVDTYNTSYKDYKNILDNIKKYYDITKEANKNIEQISQNYFLIEDLKKERIKIIAIVENLNKSIEGKSSNVTNVTQKEIDEEVQKLQKLDKEIFELETQNIIFVELLKKDEKKTIQERIVELKTQPSFAKSEVLLLDFLENYPDKKLTIKELNERINFQNIQEILNSFVNSFNLKDKTLKEIIEQLNSIVQELPDEIKKTELTLLQDFLNNVVKDNANIQDYLNSEEFKNHIGDKKDVFSSLKKTTDKSFQIIEKINNLPKDVTLANTITNLETKSKTDFDNILILSILNKIKALDTINETKTLEMLKDNIQLEKIITHNLNSNINMTNPDVIAAKGELDKYKEKEFKNIKTKFRYTLPKNILNNQKIISVESVNNSYIELAKIKEKEIIEKAQANQKNTEKNLLMMEKMGVNIARNVALNTLTFGAWSFVKRAELASNVLKKMKNDDGTYNKTKLAGLGALVGAVTIGTLIEGLDIDSFEDLKDVTTNIDDKIDKNEIELFKLMNSEKTLEGKEKALKEYLTKYEIIDENPNDMSFKQSYEDFKDNHKDIFNQIFKDAETVELKNIMKQDIEKLLANKEEINKLLENEKGLKLFLKDNNIDFKKIDNFENIKSIDDLKNQIAELKEKEIENIVNESNNDLKLIKRYEFINDDFAKNLLNEEEKKALIKKLSSTEILENKEKIIVDTLHEKYFQIESEKLNLPKNLLNEEEHKTLIEKIKKIENVEEKQKIIDDTLHEKHFQNSFKNTNLPENLFSIEEKKNYIEEIKKITNTNIVDAKKAFIIYEMHEKYLTVEMEKYNLTNSLTVDEKKALIEKLVNSNTLLEKKNILEDNLNGKLIEKFSLSDDDKKIILAEMRGNDIEDKQNIIKKYIEENPDKNLGNQSNVVVPKEFENHAEAYQKLNELGHKEIISMTTFNNISNEKQIEILKALEEDLKRNHDGIEGNEYKNLSNEAWDKIQTIMGKTKLHDNTNLPSSQIGKSITNEIDLKNNTSLEKHNSTNIPFENNEKAQRNLQELLKIYKVNPEILNGNLNATVHYNVFRNETSYNYIELHNPNFPTQQPIYMSLDDYNILKKDSNIEITQQVKVNNAKTSSLNKSNVGKSLNLDDAPHDNTKPITIEPEVNELTDEQKKNLKYGIKLMEEENWTSKQVIELGLNNGYIKPGEEKIVEKYLTEMKPDIDAMKSRSGSGIYYGL